MSNGSANHMGVGQRPSEFHNWVPGLGWVFQPEFVEGQSLAEQSQAAGGMPINPKVTQASAQAAADSGVTSYSQAMNLHRDPSWWDPTRRMQGLDQKWAYGGDLFQGQWNPETQDFNIEAYEALYDAYGSKIPNILKTDTFDQDIEGALGYLSGGSGWNPFYENGGMVSQERIDGLRAAGVIGSELTPYEQRVEGNVMDYLYDAFKSTDQMKNRPEVLSRWQKLTKDMDPGMLYGKRMNQRVFDAMGLSDFGMEFDPNYGRNDKGPAIDLSAGNPLLSGGANTSNPLLSDSVNTDRVPMIDLDRPKGGGFLGAYMAKREELANKPSVKSLFKEMENYEQPPE